MPEVTYPGVYICETGAPTPITGVSTSIAAFVGGALAGPLDQPIRIRSFVEYERTFGGIGGADPLGPVVKQYFDNGGTDAVIVRVQASPGAGATDAAIAGRGLRAARRGIFALEASDGFDLLCIPPPTPDRDVAPRTWERARRLCAARGALLLVDPPREWTSVAAARAGATSLLARDPNALVYFPRLVAPDARQCGRPADFGPCGAVAGVIARTDATRGVWKAPAGPDAILRDRPHGRDR